MDKIVFSSAHLPQGLTDVQRGHLWCNAFHENFSPVEFAMSEAPFEARLDFVQLGDVGFAQMFGSFSRAAYRRDRSAKASEQFSLITNRFARPMQLTQSGRQITIPLGSTVLLSDDLLG